jgi:hypothetical protein
MKTPTLAIGLLVAAPLALAQGGLPCAQTHALAKASQARSVPALDGANKSAAQGYLSRLVVASRRFKITANRANAEGLLAVMPVTDEQQVEIYKLSSLTCEDESDAEATALARLADKLPAQFARAVLRAPRFVPEYLQFVMLSVGDPHNDGAVQMARVCKAMKPRLKRAVLALPDKDQKFFREQVMNLDTCAPMHYPEAD